MNAPDLSTLSGDQLKVATTLDGPLFVSAGAGSGKTFTLTRRLAWALTPGSGSDGGPFLDDVSQALVITFTRAAAREIRERTRLALREAGMQDQALRVDSAWISTIHGMCARMLRRHALDLGLDPDFQVIEGQDEANLENEVLEEVVGAAYRGAKDDGPLSRAFHEYGLGFAYSGGYTGVMGIVQEFRRAARMGPRGFEGLVFPAPHDGDGLLRELHEALEGLHAVGLPAKSAAKVQDALDVVRNLEGLPQSRREPRAVVDALSGVRLPARLKAAEELARAKEALGTLRLEMALTPPYGWARDLAGLARQVDLKIEARKREEGVLGNDDLVRLALRAVRENGEFAADYAGRFRLVMVDEFQDTDKAQLELISALVGGGRGNLATVGDAQQSIYRFRGADVSVFRERGRAVEAGRHVMLHENFRSHADILSFVDFVLGGEAAPLEDYMALEASAARRDGYRARAVPRINVEVTVGFDNKGRMSPLQYALQAAAVADRLAELAASGEAPGSMALLLGTTTHADAYIDAIRERGLECVVTGGSNFAGTAEARTIAALLHTLANPHDTRSGLFPLLTSEMFALGADELVELGTRRQVKFDAPTMRPIEQGLEDMAFFGEAPESERLRHAHDVLGRAFEALRHQAIADVCLEVVRESGWLERLELGAEAGTAREANVLAAIRYVRDLTEDLGMGPARAASEFDRFLAHAKVAPASLVGGEGNAVRVMTIHASKGLEFPIVAVAECWSVRTGGGRLRTHVRGGDVNCILQPGDLAIQRGSVVDGDMGGLGGALVDAITSEQLDATAEKLRLLYVALTRAREALVVAVGASLTKNQEVRPELAATILDPLFSGEVPEEGESSFDFGGSAPGRVRVWHVHGNQDLDGAAADEEPAAGEQAGDDFAGQPEDTPEERVFRLYDHPESNLAGNLSLGTAREGVFSYSSAHALIQQEAMRREARENRRKKPGRAPRVRSLEDGAPETGDEDRATNLGSAFHELAECLVEAGGLSEARVEAVSRYWHLSSRARTRLGAALGRWEHSELRKRVLSHEVVRAEVPFFSRTSSRFGSYVEGSIDLLAYNGDMRKALLIDYKTGDLNLDVPQIYERHRMQADLYARVLLDFGFEEAECLFVCVEREDLDAPGQPLVAAYRYPHVDVWEAPGAPS